MSTLDAQQREWLRRTIAWARDIKERLGGAGEVVKRPVADRSPAAYILPKDRYIRLDRREHAPLGA